VKLRVTCLHACSALPGTSVLPVPTPPFIHTQSGCHQRAHEHAMRANPTRTLKPRPLHVQTDRPSTSANPSTVAAAPAESQRLLKARISNDCVRSCPNTQLVATSRVTLRKAMWPLHRLPNPSGGAHAMLLLISTSQSCPPHVQATGGPFDVIGAQLLPIGIHGGETPSIKLTSTLELLTVLPKLPPSLRRCLPAACPQPGSTTQPESTLRLEFAILAGTEGGSTPAPGSPEALLERMGMGTSVSLGLLFLWLPDAGDVGAGAGKGAKVEPYLLRAQRAAGGCLQLQRFDAGINVGPPTFATAVANSPAVAIHIACFIWWCCHIHVPWPQQRLQRLAVAHRC
jgi:hypothetical protein